MFKKNQAQYTRKDFISNQEVRWCPGCGDYSILAGVQKALPELVEHKEKQVFVSGIGCAARFPYYMNTYGMHSIHGRSPAFATGIKIMNPELDVWVITGDGDALSIGGNHFLHLIRRNIDINLILFNNQVYGLTKGQYSPTSYTGSKLKSTPHGSIDRPLLPLKLALGSESTFIARTADILAKNMQVVLAEAYSHHGTSVVEVLQNCHIFNDGVFKNVLDKQIRNDRLLFLENGKPMVFGDKQEKCIVLDPVSAKLEVHSVENVSDSKILIHDACNPDPTIHFMLAQMTYPDFPLAMGVIRKVKTPTYEDQAHDQIKYNIEKKGKGDLMKILYSGETWEIN